MQNKRIHIDNLHLRVPGVNRDDAQRLGQNVAEHLRTALHGSSHAGNIGSLHIRLQHNASSSSDALARTIAENIARRIR